MTSLEFIVNRTLPSETIMRRLRCVDRVIMVQIIGRNKRGEGRGDHLARGRRCCIFAGGGKIMAASEQFC